MATKVIFNNKNYNINDSALASTVTALEEHLRSMATGGGDEPVAGIAGLYQTGAIALYEEQGAEAIEGMMIKSWNELVVNGTVHVDNGVVYTNFDADAWENASSDILAGDLIIFNDASITTLAVNAFSCCKSLTSVVIPDSIAIIGDEAFNDCTSLASIVIPDGVTSIKRATFGSCENLTSVTIPDSVISIDSWAFASCTNLVSIEIPNSITDIGSQAFYGTGLVNVEIPNGITSIDMQTFSRCASLTNIEIPNSITSIGSQAFYYCTSLINITFVGTITEWNSIILGKEWNYNIPATYVQCSDGQVAL